MPVGRASQLAVCVCTEECSCEHCTCCVHMCARACWCLLVPMLKPAWVLQSRSPSPIAGLSAAACSSVGIPLLQCSLRLGGPSRPFPNHVRRSALLTQRRCSWAGALWAPPRVVQLSGTLPSARQKPSSLGPSLMMDSHLWWTGTYDGQALMMDRHLCSAAHEATDKHPSGWSVSARGTCAGKSVWASIW